MAAKGAGLLMLAGAAGLFLVLGAGKASAAKLSERERCIEVVAVGAADFMIHLVASGQATNPAEIAEMLETIGSRQGAQCVRDNEADLSPCRQLLIDALRADLRRSTPTQLEAQAEAFEIAGGPPAVIACLRKLKTLPR